ncbi:MAG: glycosyltransferase [Candidatus Marinimicrobia bacterium]|jgi:glycosyltransferase involved in cell wall biosynthesis|nr:glycosyltransferase [Candidatus Neomarinimicrobiota bacterium]
MKKINIGIVTAWGECGMGYIAKNWVYTLEKYNFKFNYNIFCRAVDKFTPFRWKGNNVIQGPETMNIDNKIFWNWIDTFKPEIILFQDQNTYSNSKMVSESTKLRGMGIKLINYADWIYQNDLKNYKGLYDINLAHISRNYDWLLENKLEHPILIKWGVILKNFPFKIRQVEKVIKFYINLGSGSDRKGYQYIPKALKLMKGNFLRRIFLPIRKNYEFNFTSQYRSEKNLNRKFLNEINNISQCNFIIQTADNSKGGLFNKGDVYVYPTTMEGVGLTITEAMASGMPVVTTNYPTMNEWLNDNIEGRLINIKKTKKTVLEIKKVIPDTKHLAEILIDYIDNPKIVKEQSINARKRIEKFYDWDDRDEQIITLFDI